MRGVRGKIVRVRPNFELSGAEKAPGTPPMQPEEKQHARGWGGRPL